MNLTTPIRSGGVFSAQLNEMNVYIDTSILYEDPFWQNSYNKVLLERARKGKLNLLLSTVVLKELRRNYEKQVDELIKKMADSAKDITRRFSVEKLAITIPEKDVLCKNFELFYNDLANNAVITVIDFENSFLPEIVERAVWRRKPFTESKTELKDTLIWLSYAKHVRENKITDCYLLTTNVNDFCRIINKDTKIFEVHEDLKGDCDSFKVIKYTKDFISEIIEKIEAENKSRYKEIAKQKVDINFVTQAVYSRATVVEDDVRKEVEAYDARTLFKIDYFFTGYVQASVIGWADKCKDIVVDILDDCCIVSGYQELDVEIEAYEYNAGRDHDEDDHYYFGETNITVNAYFTFTLDLEFNVDVFEIADVDLK